MYNREEEKLFQAKAELDNLDIPLDRLDEAIIGGIKKGKLKKHKRNLWVRTFAAAAVFVIAFTAMLRVSDTFASFVSTIPGMEKLVELARHDKGLRAAIENEFVQKAGVSDEHDGLKVTLDYVVADEQMLVIFYHYETSKDHQSVWSEDISLTDSKGRSLDYALSFGGEVNNLQEGDSPLYKLEYLLGGKELPKDLVLSLKLKEGSDFEDRKVLDDEWVLPFSVDTDKFLASKKEIDINETVTVEGQKITVKKVTIYPTRVGVRLHYHEDNSKKIFSIEDIHLVDETGEKWSSIANGVSGSRISENEHEIFLQSNFFHEPEELSLRFSSLRALNKNELTVVVDPTKPELIEAPSDGLLMGVERRGGDLAFSLKADFQHQAYGIFDYAVDANGKTIANNRPISFSSGSVKGVSEIYVPYYEAEAAPGPITLELIDYPARIHGDVKIKLY